jgi:molecular chaperone GrpE
MTTGVMDKVLGKFEVKNMNPLGEKFDPNLHDAMMMIPETEEYPDNTVGLVV